MFHDNLVFQTPLRLFGSSRLALLDQFVPHLLRQRFLSPILFLFWWRLTHETLFITTKRRRTSSLFHYIFFICRFTNKVELVTIWSAAVIHTFVHKRASKVEPSKKWRYAPCWWKVVTTTSVQINTWIDQNLRVTPDDPAEIWHHPFFSDVVVLLAPSSENSRRSPRSPADAPSSRQPPKAFISRRILCVHGLLWQNPASREKVSETSCLVRWRDKPR